MTPILAAIPLLLAASAVSEPPMPEQPSAPPAAQAAAGPASAASQFAVDLYGILRRREGDVFFSPLSVSAALTMTAAGAKGETARQMNRTLHLDPLGPDAHEELGRWVDALRASIKDARTPPPDATKQDRKEAGLWMANAVWIDEREKLLPDFAAFLDRSFHAHGQAVDFAGSPDAARETINQWVEDQTRDRITDLLKPRHVTRDTVVVLTSAIYFKGYWAHPFSTQATRDDDFHPATGDAVKVKMMNQSGRFPYFENESLQALEMPYKDGSSTMLVVLPRRSDGLGAVEASLSVEALQSWIAGLKPNRVQVSLPKFTSTVETELKEPLAELGMPIAFRGDADFSGITGSPDFSISAVVHKAFVEVEEKGTEAAAATAVVAVRAAAIAPVKEFVFRADHPFLYLIRDAETGAILFMGRLSRP